jgi:hypothetical protein
MKIPIFVLEVFGSLLLVKAHHAFFWGTYLTDKE